MYRKKNILYFFDNHRLHIYGSWNTTKQKKTKKILQCPSISYGNGFFLKRKDYYAFIFKNKKTTNFLNEIPSKFLNSPRFNWYISIHFTLKKSSKISIHNLNF